MHIRWEGVDAFVDNYNLCLLEKSNAWEMRLGHLDTQFLLNVHLFHFAKAPVNQQLVIESTIFQLAYQPGFDYSWMTVTL